MQSNFKNDKKVALEKIDKSKKGSIDKKIQNLIDLINSKKDYYTTSSCSGRIMLMDIPEKREKNKVKWLLQSHEIVEKIELNKIKFENELWFKQESFILHVRARDLDAANKLLIIANELGLKRSGVYSLNRKIILELIGNENIEVILGTNGNLLVAPEHFELILSKANDLMSINQQKIAQFETTIEKI